MAQPSINLSNAEKELFTSIAGLFATLAQEAKNLQVGAVQLRVAGGWVRDKVC